MAAGGIFGGGFMKKSSQLIFRQTRHFAMFAALLGLAVVPDLVQAKKAQSDASVAVVAMATMPPQARDTYERIRQGGPFAYEKDGVVFGNRERILPSEKRGYYHEYTVKTPGSRDRGARRIVCGGPAKTPDACFYSDDHYSSFRRIVP